jgi:hypothetical protein
MLEHTPLAHQLLEKSYQRLNVSLEELHRAAKYLCCQFLRQYKDALTDSRPQLTSLTENIKACLNLK